MNEEQANNEYVESFISTVTKELATIKDEYLSSEKIKIVNKDNVPVRETYPDTTKEQWLECTNGIVESYNKEFAEREEFIKTNPDAEFPLPILIPNVFLTPNVFVDEEIVNAAKGFMVGPVGIFRNKAVVAETQVYPNIYEMRTFLINAQCKTKDMVLYITYTQDRQDFGNRDPFKMTPEEIDNAPMVKVYCWRGAFVDKI